MKHLSRDNLINEAHTQSKSIALIYSPVELNEYIVEIISKTSNLFIRKHNHISHFHSVHDAVTHAQKHGAKEFFLCVDNTYDECGSSRSVQPFDYIPIHSKYTYYKN